MPRTSSPPVVRLPRAAKFAGPMRCGSSSAAGSVTPKSGVTGGSPLDCKATPRPSTVAQGGPKVLRPIRITARRPVKTSHGVFHNVGAGTASAGWAAWSSASHGAGAVPPRSAASSASSNGSRPVVRHADRSPSH